MKNTNLAVWAALLVICASSASAAILQVGPGRAYSTVQAAVNAASSGDTIQIDPGTYYVSNGWAAINTDVTIVGMGAGRPVLDALNLSLNGKAIFLVNANVTIQNLEFCHCHCGSQNGSGVLVESGNVTIQNCYFHDNDDGVRTGAGTAYSLLMDGCEFNHNGYGDGQSHNMYVGNIGTFTLQHCWSHNANRGHLVKTRANVNYILYNRLGDEGGSNTYECSACQGGTTYVIGNQIEQTSASGNNTIIDYASEGALNPDSHLYVLNNTVVNNRYTGIFVHNYATVPALVQNNIFQGAGTAVSGPATQANNWSISNASLVNPAGYDFHLTASSTGAIDLGGVSSPATGIDGFSLVPVQQYVHPCSYQSRSNVGSAIDIGAFEYGITVPIYPAPTVTASADPSFIIWPTNSITLTGTATNTSVPPNGTFAYTWSQVSGPGMVTFSAPGQPVTISPFTTTATFSAVGTYVVQLTAGNGATTSSTNLTINILQAAPPTVRATPAPGFAYENWPITLSCTTTNSSDGFLTYNWTQTAGIAVSLTGAATSTASFVVPMVSRQTDSPLTFQIDVTDSQNATATDTVSIQVYMTGDIDHDYNVNLSDMKLLIAAWNSTPTSGTWNAAADLDNSGTVILADLKLLMANWNRAMLP